MFAWYRELLEIRRENNRENELIETLKHEIEMLRIERDTLLQHALNRDDKISTPPVVEQEFKPVPASSLPWNARRQLLEREDRAKAKILKSKETERLETTVEELEKELNIVESERNS